MKQFKYTINGNVYEVSVGDIKDNIVDVTVNGDSYQVAMEPEKKEEPKPVVRPVVAAKAATSSNTNSRIYNEKVVKAPLPGLVIDIKVKVGDEVKVGDTVVVLEAMKMNNNLEAECAGKVVEINVQSGQTVMDDEVLIVIE